eukprot:465664-Prorocentrum_minimum.AAC.1
MSGVRVFGCRAFVHVPPGDRAGKLGARSTPGLYVGHDDRSSAYLSLPRLPHLLPRRHQPRGL